MFASALPAARLASLARLLSRLLPLLLAAAQIMAHNVWVDWTKKTLASAEPVHLSSPDRELQAIKPPASVRKQHRRLVAAVDGYGDEVLHDLMVHSDHHRDMPEYREAMGIPSSVERRRLKRMAG